MVLLLLSPCLENDLEVIVFRRVINFLRWTLLLLGLVVVAGSLSLFPKLVVILLLTPPFRKLILSLQKEGNQTIIIIQIDRRRIFEDSENWDSIQSSGSLEGSASRFLEIGGFQKYEE